MLRSILFDGCPGHRSIAAVKILGLPNEVLEQITGVFCEDELLGLLNHAAEIVDQSLAF